MSGQAEVDLRNEGRSQRLLWNALVPLAIALVGVAFRIVPELHGAIFATADYDEGVYVSAARALSHGILPYRDFTLLHPPGLIIALTPLAHFFGPEMSFGSARVVLACCGGATAALVYVCGRQFQGRIAGLFGGVLYASLPLVIASESRVLLDPLVNVLVVGASALYLSPRRGKWSTCATGLLLGLALSVKLSALIYVMPMLVPLFLRKRSLRDFLGIFGIAIGTFATILLPFVLTAGPPKLIQQIFESQLNRPTGQGLPGNVASMIERLAMMLGIGPLSARTHFPDPVVLLLSVLLIAAIVLWVLRRSMTGTYWSAVLGIGAGLTLVGSSFYEHYVLVTAPAVCILIGGTMNWVTCRMTKSRSIRIASVLPIAALLLVWQAKVQLWTLRQPGVPLPAEEIRLAAGQCLYSDNPQIVLLANLETQEGVRSPTIDPFGTMLLVGRQGSNSVLQALRSEPAQAALRGAVEQCESTLFLGPPQEQPGWSAPTVEWLKKTHELAWTNGAIEVWRRLPA